MIEHPSALWMSLIFDLGIFLGAIRWGWKSIPCMARLGIFSAIMIAMGLQLAGDFDNLTRFNFYLSGTPSLRSLLAKGIILSGFAYAELVLLQRKLKENG
jgi:ABC-type uncharacterized transport system permease subunit